MPWRDGTGSWGYGPMAGRGRGPCGRGMASRRGFCMGYGWRYWQGVPVAEPAALTKDEQRRILDAELKDIEAERQEIEKRLKEL